MPNIDTIAWLPEFIDSGSLDGLRLIPGVRAQAETREDLAEVAKQLDLTVAEAARWVMEVGIATLYRAGALNQPEEEL